MPTTAEPSDLLTTPAPTAWLHERLTYDMDATSMLFQRRGCGIHVVSAEPERAADRNHQSQKYCGSPAACAAAVTATTPGPIPFLRILAVSNREDLRGEPRPLT